MCARKTHVPPTEAVSNKLPQLRLLEHESETTTAAPLAQPIITQTHSKHIQAHALRTAAVSNKPPQLRPLEHESEPLTAALLAQPIITQTHNEHAQAQALNPFSVPKPRQFPV